MPASQSPRYGCLVQKHFAKLKKDYHYYHYHHYYHYYHYHYYHYYLKASIPSSRIPMLAQQLSTSHLAYRKQVIDGKDTDFKEVNREESEQKPGEQRLGTQLVGVLYVVDRRCNRCWIRDSQDRYQKSQNRNAHWSCLD